MSKFSERKTLEERQTKYAEAECARLEKIALLCFDFAKLSFVSITVAAFFLFLNDPTRTGLLQVAFFGIYVTGMAIYLGNTMLKTISLWNLNQS